jgi:hypothetical protein
MNPQAEHFGTEEVDLRSIWFTPELLACLPAELARRCRALPVSVSSDRVRVAFADLCDLDSLETVSRALHRELEVASVDPAQLDEFIGRLYGTA